MLQTSANLRYFDLIFGLPQKTLQHKPSSNLRYIDLTFLWTVTEDIATNEFSTNQRYFDLIFL